MVKYSVSHAMYVTKTSQIWNYIGKPLLVVDTPVLELLITELVRKHEGEEITFLALRNIEVKEGFRNKGYASRVLERLAALKRPVMIDHILNPWMEKKGRALGMTPFSYRKNSEEINCLIKL